MVDCETSVRRLAIVGQGLPASSIAYDYKSLPPDGRRCRANSETDEGECGGLRMAGKHCQPKAFPLEGKVANAMSRMRCRLHSSRQQNYIGITPLWRLHLIRLIAFATFSSRRRLWVGRAGQHMQGAAFPLIRLAAARHLLPREKAFMVALLLSLESTLPH